MKWLRGSGAEAKAPKGEGLTGGDCEDWRRGEEGRQRPTMRKTICRSPGHPQGWQAVG